jgi:thymidylate synthase ThyX
MSHSARILADSITESGDRLTTFELTFPRYVLAEFNTHRVFARNSASSRAIPVAKRITAVDEDPFIPEFGKNQPGMQAGEALRDDESIEAETIWLSAKNAAVRHATKMMEIGVHKQVANRILEPFAWHTVICTATAWENFFLQRSQHHTDMADPAISVMATLAEDLYRASAPKLLQAGDWHLPLFSEANGGSWEDFYDALTLAEELEVPVKEIEKRVSTARCARVSYMTHDGVRDMRKDLELYEDTLAKFGHWSPLEHVATPSDPNSDHQGCFTGWDQFRHEVEKQIGISTYV